MKKIGNKPAAQVFFLPPMSPKITLEKEKKKNMETTRRKKGGEEKSNGCTVS